jgi:hypothetical protein
MEMNIRRELLLVVFAVVVPSSEGSSHPGFALPEQASRLSVQPTKERSTADPPAVAARLAADAHAARAAWKAFPGFVADVEVTLDGKVGQGRVIVLADGRVYVESLPENHRALAACHLTCLVHGQLDKPPTPGAPWPIVGGAKEQRSGGIRCRTDDPFGFRYRIQNRQMVAIEHRSNGGKLTLHLLEWYLNPEKKHLPAVVTVHASNTHTQKLESTATQSLTWRRVGRFDLPATVRVLSAGVYAQESPFVELKLMNHQLCGPGMPMVADN